MKELLEAAVENLPGDTSLSLLELLRYPCPVSHAYRFSGESRGARFEEMKDARLRNAVEEEHRKFLRRYLGEAEAIVGFTPSEAPVRINESFHIPILGTLAGWPLYAHYTSRAPLAPPAESLSIGVVLADKFQKDRSCMLLVNRENLQWTAWSISSVSPDHAAEVQQDAHFAEGVIRGLAPREGIRRECLTCPYETDCDAAENEKAEEAAAYSTSVSAVRSVKLEQMLDAHLEALNERDDGRNTGWLSPSEISTTKCDRRLWYKGTKAPRRSVIAPGLRRIFDMGNAVHEVLQRLLHQSADSFQSEVRAHLPGCTVVGSCDGLLGEEGLEIKSISHKGFESLRKTPKTPHHRQGSIYGSALGVPRMLYVYYNKTSGALRYLHKDVDKAYADEVRRKANRIENLIQQGRKPERQADYGCRMCAYTKICKPELPEIE